MKVNENYGYYVVIKSIEKRWMTVPTRYRGIDDPALVEIIGHLMKTEKGEHMRLVLQNVKKNFDKKGSFKRCDL